METLSCFSDLKLLRARVGLSSTARASTGQALGSSPASRKPALNQADMIEEEGYASQGPGGTWMGPEAPVDRPLTGLWEAQGWSPQWGQLGVICSSLVPGRQGSGQERQQAGAQEEAGIVLEGRAWPQQGAGREKAGGTLLLGRTQGQATPGKLLGQAGAEGVLPAGLVGCRLRGI